MKIFTRNLLISIALCFALTSADAQYVTIPDANFRTWLNTNGYASCMNGNQMDTTCNAVVNASFINCNGAGISNLTGIQYFDGLTDLACYNNQLTTLPPLPSYLSSLICFNNQLTSLPSLSNTLDDLDCHNNLLNSLPSLPPNIIILHCDNNHLSSLPALPPALTYFTCGYNNLTSLPSLPPGMYSIECNNNNLSSLPALPGSLNTIWCNNNQLQSLPSLPSSLKTVYSQFNQLTTLTTLPDTLDNLVIDHNPGLTCLPPIKRINGFQWNNTGITCLPNVISVNSATPSITGVPICPAPPIPASISVSGGSAKVCPGDTRSYSTPLVNGVTYNWTVPAGAVIINGQGTRVVTVTYNNGFAGGSISVTKKQGCGVSAPKSVQVKLNIPSTPSAITGLTYGLCGANNKVYSVTQVTGMTYQWTVPAVATIVNGQGTNSIIVNFPSINFTGTVSVKAVNACGAGNARNLTVRAIPSTPVSITGSTTACANQQNVAYSTAAIATATSYTWGVPSGSLITSGQGTNSIVMKFGTAGGNVKVRASNTCANSSYRNLVVTINCREGAENFQPFQDVLIYPNPSKNYFTVNISNSAESNYSLIVRDVIGKIVYQKQTISTAESFDFGAELLSGAYFAEVMYNDERRVMRLIKR